MIGNISRLGKKYFVVGEDSMRVARMFPGKVELRRPMQDGILNKEEDKKEDFGTKAVINQDEVR